MNLNKQPNHPETAKNDQRVQLQKLIFQSRKFKPTDESAQDFVTNYNDLHPKHILSFSIDQQKEDAQPLKEKTVQTSVLDEFANLSLTVCQ